MELRRHTRPRCREAPIHSQEQLSLQGPKVQSRGGKCSSDDLVRVVNFEHYWHYSQPVTGHATRYLREFSIASDFAGSQSSIQKCLRMPTIATRGTEAKDAPLQPWHFKYKLTSLLINRNLYTKYLSFESIN